MKFFFLLLFQININIIFAASDNDKEYAKAERKVKSLACSILANTRFAYSNQTKRQLRDLLKRKKIIQRAAESHTKIFEFLRAICFKKIQTSTANRIIESVSNKEYEILEREEYAELFQIDNNLNFTRIKNVIKRVNKIMKKIEEEEENKKKNETLNETEKEGLINITLFKNIGDKTFFGVYISFMFIVLTSIIFFNKKNKKEYQGNEIENNEDKKKSNKKDNDNNEENKEKVKDNNESNKKNYKDNKDKEINNK